MPTYFRGWRRKIGVMTLVMACVFTSGWVRSFLTTDEIVQRHEAGDYAILISSNGYIGLIGRSGLQSGGTPGMIFLWSASTKSFQTALDWPKSRFLGFRFGTRDDVLVPGRRYTYSVIPYWSIVLPFTLLSVYLLLSKPRVAKPAAVIEP